MTTEVATIEVPATLAERTQTLVVVDDETREAAKALQGELQDLGKAISDYFDPLVEAAHKSHKQLTTKRAEALKPIKEWQDSIKSKILAYNTAKAERERREREAEQARLLEEKRQQEAEAAKLAQEAELAKRVGAVEVAAALEQQSKAIEATAFHVGRSATAIKPGKPEGTREIKRWRIVDKSIVPREYLIPDAAKLDFEAKRGTPIDGVEYYSEFVLHGRG